MSLQTMKVLDALLTKPNSSGADVNRSTGIASGTLYPILLRLEEAGWLTSAWEAGDPVTLGRPRKRYYAVTAEGQRAYREAISQIAPTKYQVAFS
jgi:PadR family transcriptional regulator, regulatory protein PadR